MLRLQDKVVIVTGSGQGMGLAIAKCCAKEGAKIVVTDINDETIAKAVEELKGLGVDAFGVRMDVTNKEHIAAMVAKVVERWGVVDVLVNNAGGGLNTPYKLDEIEEKHWDLVVNVNMKGTFLCCQQVIPQMAKQGHGSIVNISALAGHWRASLAGVQYTAAKAGVEGVSRQLAYDWGHKGIRVNSLAPTVTMTGQRMQGLWDDKGEAERERILSAIPLRRLSTPEEIGAGVVFLASEDASYITGITLDVCGGRYLR